VVEVGLEVSKPSLEVSKPSLGLSEGLWQQVRLPDPKDRLPCLSPSGETGYDIRVVERVSFIRPASDPEAGTSKNKLWCLGEVPS